MIGLRKWWPTLIFVTGIVITLLVVYKTAYPLVGVSIGCVVVLGYIYFVYSRHPNQFAVTVSSLAFGVGPMITTVYVSVHSPNHLYRLAHEGGDVLIQLSFFFSGLLILLFAGGAAFFNKSASLLDRIEGLLPFAIIVGMLLWTMFATDASHALVRVVPPKIAIGKVFHAPPMTPLMVWRMVLLFYSIFVATRPRNGDSAMADQTVP